MSDFNLGTVTAYGYAKDKGYTGTEDEYAELMASYADVAEQAAESAEQAAASATTATAKASEAAQSATAAASSKTAAETAQGGAETAAQTATTKAGEATTAATTATNKATEATTAATTATGKATEAAGSATTATTKAGEASTSATNAAASATRAQEILDSIPEDYSQMSEDVSDLKDGLTAVESDVTDLKEDYTTILDSAYVTDTASGAIASFPDGADGVPVKSLMVDIEPVQDLHGQANPYPAGGSKNKCKPINNGTFNGVTVSTDATGKTTVTGTATGGGGRLNLCSDSFTLPAGTYTVSHNGSGTWGYTLSLSAPGGSQLYECRATSTYTTFTLSAETTLVVGISIKSGNTYNGTIEPQIESGSSKTAYVPYSNICPISGHTSAVVTVSPTTDAQDGTSYTISLDGTRYGGTLDVGTGVLTVDRQIVDLGTLNWTQSNTTAGAPYPKRWLSNTVSGLDGDIYSVNCISNKYKGVKYSGSSSDDVDALIIGKTNNVISSEVRGYINVVDVSLYDMTPAQVKEALSGTYAVCRSVAQTIQLSSTEVRTLLAQNNVFADCGDTTVEYRADTKLYINKVLNA